MSIADLIWTLTAADHVTEREPGPWRDCLFAAILEWLRAGLNDRTIPATVAQKEALRAAVGLPDDHPGATLEQGIWAAERLFGPLGGWRIIRDWPSLRDHLTTATGVAVVTGRMGALSSHWRRWDPGFAGGHATTLYGHAATSPTWCDPLAPKGTYHGEPMPLATLKAYFDGLPGALLADVGGLRRLVMAILFELERWSIPAGTPIFDVPDGAELFRLAEPHAMTTLGIPLDRSTDASPGRNYGWRALLLNTKALDGMTGRKVAYIRKPVAGPIATPPEWDAFVWSALGNPNSWKPAAPPPDTTPFDQNHVNAMVNAALSKVAEAIAEARP